MKRITIILLILSVLVFSLFANQDQKKYPEHKKGMKLSSSRTKAPAASNSREFEVPPYSVSIPPTEIITSFFDYMPGSYDSKPVRIFKNGDDLQHMYFVFHAKSTATAERYVYYAYFDNDGNMTYDRVTGSNVREGYPGVVLDIATGDPLVGYHHNMNGDGRYHCAFTYDLNHFIGGAGYWSEPITVIDNDNNPASPNGALDEFIWPYTFISNSPVSDNHRRIYMFSRNSADNAGNANDENECYAYADFTTSDLESLSPFNWTIQTIPQMDVYVNDRGLRPYHVIDVTEDGKICIFGYFHPNDELITDEEPETFLLYNDNFGNADDWSELIYNSEKWVDPPLDQDGSNTLLEDPYFTNYFSSHLNAQFDVNGNFHWLSNYGLMGNSLDSGEGVFIEHRFYLKHLYYNPSSGNVTYQDLYPKGVDPYDEYPYLPWDEDEDGEVDSFSEDGEALTALGWPIYYNPTDGAWDDVNFKISYNKETGWMAAVWQDGVKNVLTQEYDSPDYTEWNEVPEICIAMSYDHGMTWSGPIMLNANDTPALEGMIPEYVYPSDQLIKINETTERMYLFFLDDNDFGSHAQTDPSLPNTGGRINYMALDIGVLESSDDPAIPSVQSIKVENYPNPFVIGSTRNSVTTIRFNLPEKDLGKIEIFNTKGQLVKSVYEGKFDKDLNSYSWDGTCNSGDHASTGVYFTKVSTSKNNFVSKLLLIR